MEILRPAVIGIGATGQAIAAALLIKRPETMLAVTREEGRERLMNGGIRVEGVINLEAKPVNVAASVAGLSGFGPDAVFIATKTFHLEKVAAELAELPGRDFLVISCHNGLGPEDYLAERFGKERVFRMSLNYGAVLVDQGSSRTTFFNSPNFLGPVDPSREGAANALAALLTEGGLATAAVSDIRETVWKKMIMKCSMASIGALTDMSIRDCLKYPPTREIAFGCFNEALAVAKASGYDLGPEYLEKAVAYIEEAGVHKDSMCHDVEAGRPTEIDYLGGRIVQYGKKLGIPTPHFLVTTNLVKALEKRIAAGKGQS